MVEFQFPIRDRSEPLATGVPGVLRAAVAQGKLDATEADVVRTVAMRLLTDGARTFADAEARLEHMSPAERRQLVGKPTAEAEMQRPPRRWAPDAAGRRLTECSAPDCGVVPSNPDGSLRPVSDRRWWCPEHHHLAGPEDHQAAEPSHAIDFATMRLVPVGEEAARLRAEDEKVQAEHRERVEARRREGEALEKVRQRYIEDQEFSVAGVKLRHDGKLVEP